MKLSVFTTRISSEAFYRNHPQKRLLKIFSKSILNIGKPRGFFPPGIPRHVIKRRCLNVNLPFSVFNKNDSIGTQNRNLEQFLRQRKFRLYEEPTIYFE